ncbi:ATP-dependent nuclease [Burkholderia diffusa]|uniref:ATP-dependent nuclease n=1 Tax=Burkholderia diffusa TaxID=488732 RepID=UPI0008422744|nr:AAA family ATPase [Burkholderia diffusa]
MNDLKIKIENVKNIKSAEIEFPLEQSLSLIVGSNGSGKSTILLALSQAIRNSLKSLESDDYDASSKVEIGLDGKVDVWSGANGWSPFNQAVSLRGMYEGSLFYGTRFNDSRTVDSHLKSGKIADRDIVDADDYVKEKLSQILTGTANKYKDLKRIKNRAIAQKLNLTSTPYFNSINGNLISQYRMSSGECLLISLLHFVYNAIVRRSLANDQLILVLIDEIELALHPIAVSRFIDLINELVQSTPNLMVILTSHSPEVIRKIQPKNIYKIENNSGIVDVVNPGYPSYVIRDVYRHDGFDYLLLVEDILAKVLVEKVLESKNLGSSKLVHVVPVGGYTNVLTLQRDLLRGNVLGVGREIISILDGDIADKVPKDFSDLKKLFLPIKSIEKFLYSIVIDGTNPPLKKTINDKYFQLDSLDSLAAEHNEKYKGKVDQPDKKFYYRLRKNLEARGIDELMFAQKLSDDIMRAISFEKFSNSIESLLNK